MTTTVQVTCLCAKHAETLELQSDLPVISAPCSCNSCRYSTGLLYYSDLPLTSRPNAVDRLTKYDSSSKLSRYFCPDCVSPMFVEVHGDPSCEVHGDHVWSVSSGVIDRVDDHETGAELSLEQIVQHDFVGDTRDGGLAVCLDQVNGQPVPFFLAAPGGPKHGGTVAELLKRLREDPSIDSNHIRGYNDQPSGDQNDLWAECHCGGVSFLVTRPNAASRQYSSPWPDLVVPYHSSSSKNLEEVKWWLRENDTKYLAGTCACRSCRLGSGSPIQAWAFVPKANLLQRNGKALSYDMGTLKQVESSDGCYREFCDRCGANVFWHCLERPDLIDVSVGLLRAPEGARASTWLDWWTDRVSFREHAFDKKLIDQLGKGLRNIR